jgi:serine/threonine protein kinase
MSFCPKCGTEVQEGGRFCPSCGTAVKAPAAPAGDPYIGRKLDNKFLIDDLLGVGGMGKVYKATQLSLDKTVCVKVLRSMMMSDETLVGRFHQEARAASRLNHPNSITVIDFGQDPDDGSLYLVMEYVPGRDLGKIIREDHPLAEPRVVHIMDQVLSALADAHAANIIHRDLKPENIMVTDLRGTKDFVKVLDFGIAKLQESTTNEPGLTQVGMVCGTPEYMSPEQARGEVLDARSDVYAAGVILYQMVVGRIPFTAPTAMGIVTKHLTEPPVPPSKVDGITVSAALEKVVLKAMSKDRNGRPKTALALQQELNAVLSQKVAYAQQTPLGTNLFDDESTASGKPKPTMIRPENSQQQPAPSEQSAPVAEGGSKAWLWITLLIVVLGGGGAAGYFLWWLPQHEGKDGDDAGIAVEDAGLPVEEPAAMTPDAGAIVEPPEDAGVQEPEVDAGSEEPEVDAGVAEPADPGVETPPEKDVPEVAKQFYQAGKELMVQNKLKKAIAVFGKAIKKAPDYAAPYKAMGMCHMRLGRIKKAKQNFRTYLKKAPDAEDAADIRDLIESL